MSDTPPTSSSESSSPESVSGRVNLARWLKRITEAEMPVLSHTSKQIAAVAEDVQNPMSELVDLIQQDAAMTMHVLRLTDSAYHIRRTSKNNTITRAVVMLGFDEVRSMCLTVTVLEQLTKGSSREQVVQEMARAFHAAVQARYLAMQRGDRASEEVFIAALLFRLGEMVFWHFGEEEAEKVILEMEETGCSRKDAERKILGFTLKELTLCLCRAWGLGNLLEKAVRSEDPEDARCEGIMLSYRLLEAVEQGWESSEVEKIVVEMAAFANLPTEVLEENLVENSKEALTVAKSFGAQVTADHIPVLTDRLGKKKPEGEKESAAASEETTLDALPKEPVITKFPDPDPMLQLKILRGISTLLEMGSDVNDVMELVLDGIYRGIGMDRASFALLSPNRKYLRIKSSLGASQQHFLHNFKFEVSEEKPNVFLSVIRGEVPVWISAAKDPEIKKLIPPNIDRVIGQTEFYVAPVMIKGKVIGVLYADRSQSGRKLDRDAFEAFKQFALHANLCLEHLGGGKSAPQDAG